MMEPRGATGSKSIIKPLYQPKLKDENFVGIGITIKRDKQTGSFIVGRVFPNGPAFSLVNPGDVLESIDKTSLDGLRTQEVAALILGPAGSVVQLVVKDGGCDDGSLRVLCLERQALAIPSTNNPSAPSPTQAEQLSDGAQNPANVVAERLHLEDTSQRPRTWPLGAVRSETESGTGPAGTGGGPESLDSMDSEAGRLRTFGRWPHPPDALPFAHPAALAAAGFFLRGTAETPDLVVCAYCGLQLADWAPEDDPAAEHRRMSPSCVYAHRPSFHTPAFSPPPPDPPTPGPSPHPAPAHRGASASPPPRGSPRGGHGGPVSPAAGRGRLRSVEEDEGGGGGLGDSLGALELEFAAAVAGFDSAAAAAAASGEGASASARSPPRPRPDDPAGGASSGVPGSYRQPGPLELALRLTGPANSLSPGDAAAAAAVEEWIGGSGADCSEVARLHPGFAATVQVALRLRDMGAIAGAVDQEKALLAAINQALPDGIFWI